MWFPSSGVEELWRLQWLLCTNPCNFKAPELLSSIIQRILCTKSKSLFSIFSPALLHTVIYQKSTCCLLISLKTKIVTLNRSAFKNKKKRTTIYLNIVALSKSYCAWLHNMVRFFPNFSSSFMTMSSYFLLSMTFLMQKLSSHLETRDNQISNPSNRTSPPSKAQSWPFVSSCNKSTKLHTNSSTCPIHQRHHYRHHDDNYRGVRFVASRFILA